MGAVNTTYTFTATDTITSTKMNNIIDQTTMTDEAISGSTLEVTSSGRLKVRALGITSNEMSANSVTTNAITDLNVTTGKIADLNVTTGKIADLAVTNAKIANSTIEKSKLSQSLSIGTPQSPTLATADFTSIPSWVTRITILFDGLSTNGTSNPLIQLGDSGGFENTGYTSSSSAMFESAGNNVLKTTSTAGFVILSNKAADQLYGSFVLSLFSTNKWAASSAMVTLNDTAIVSAGTKTLSDALTQIRITTVGGTNVFDGGSVNIMFE